MRHLFPLFFLSVGTLGVLAQDVVPVDRAKYPDYNPNLPVDARLLRYGAAARARGLHATPLNERPAAVNNAATRHFAPIFNQSGGSCGSASRVGYMFTHEINSYRDLDGTTSDHYYPTHFSWLHTYCNSGKDEFVSLIGIPTAKTYGGQTYSALFGEQDWNTIDFGWMTGYDKWFEAMNNRMEKPVRLPGDLMTPEGRELAKRWLWNHNGDPDFHSGGLLGIGVASNITPGSVPRTDTNTALGVAGQEYVKWWGTSVDHAMTIVGYDDRIEFDLDGNGKAGETEKDEVGAWILVNSWGTWANGGLIYCPYANSGPVHEIPNPANKSQRRLSGAWTPEIYNVRKNYRPLRTLKVRMDYSHRSEIILKAGVSANLNANVPEKEIELHHFRWAGDCKYGYTTPAPAVPMLGRWADGRMHNEPMEFGYDLTDLTAGYDRSQPLKYFFTVDARNRSMSENRADRKPSIGQGHLYHVGIVDYEFDREGIETIFDLGGEQQEVPGAKITRVSTIVYGEQYGQPLNLSITGSRLSWTAPVAGGHTATAYRITRDGQFLAEATDTHFDLPGAGRYGVSAVFESGVTSEPAYITTAVEPQSANVAIDLRKNGFIIPDLFTNHFQKATIEYWIKPTTLADWNQAVGPGWGQFMLHANADGSCTAGWDTNARTQTLAGALKVGKWSHVAVVVSGNNFRLHLNGGAASMTRSNSYSGIGGFGSLVFSASEGKNSAHDAVIDEIRIWDSARPAATLKAMMNTEFSGNVLPEGLLAYYKGDLIEIDGRPHLRDCVGGHHAPLINMSDGTFAIVDSEQSLSAPTVSTFTNGNCSIKGSSTTVAGQPLTLNAHYPDGAATLIWNAPEAGIKDYHGSALSLSYPQSGTFDVQLTVSDVTGTKSFTATKTITVSAPDAPDATFSLHQQTIPAGERITLTPKHPMPGYTYHWTMPTALTPASHAITAATAFDTRGTHAITLTVTSPTGVQATTTQKVQVIGVAPQADFRVDDAVVLRGTPAHFTDASTYRPTEWEWMVSSATQTYVTNAQQPTLTIDHPGTYDVQLTARNDMGIGTTTKSRALTVVNADSKTGLSFGNPGARVVAQPPLHAGDKTATIEWWMNPARLSGYTCGIGERDASFLIKASPTGQLLICRSNRVVQTENGVVIPNEWHHYAVTFDGYVVSIYRDGLLLRKDRLSTSLFPALSEFALSTAAAQMNGRIDELRVWGTALSIDKIRAYANAPIADVTAAEQGEDRLLLYYDFNQSSGAVIDRTSSARHGVRTGFGPDGDAWGRSAGVFSLNFEQPEDITAQKLSNFKKPFLRTTQSVNTTTAGRWWKIRDWTLENTHKQGNIVSGVHVDAQKNNCFTFTTGWDNFPTLTNHKCYQVMTLPPGAYTFTALFEEDVKLGHSDATGSHLVVAAGTSLPDTEQLSEAIASIPMTATGGGAGHVLRFVLTEEREVALGLLINMTGRQIAMIQRFTLTRSALNRVTGIDTVIRPEASSSSSQDYDLMGRRVLHPERGTLIIRNGRPVLAD